MTSLCLRGPMLHPQLLILTRPSGAVQLGWDPESARQLAVPGIDPDTLLHFLQLLDGLRTRPQIMWRATELGLTPHRASQLLATLDDAGLLLHPDTPAGRVRRVRVHGLGPLSDAITTGLRRFGLRPQRSRGPRIDLRPRPDLVLLTDTLVPDPRLIDQLLRARIAHLPVRLRDGDGLVGPLVQPGRTSCLRCADLLRADYDPDWPRLAAQLLGRVGHASRSGIEATAALALRELESIIACSVGRPPAVLEAQLELDLDSYRLEIRRWAPHARCVCRRIRAGTDGST
ncbi:TOMM precursor leader peptide-binding protein [Nocardia sp. NPDC059180]|uniref:TOMM precursor leader peptide-binding protein n=1 Tax=Nocardia sp. NPDC059180 TaxID=3346761 RepID=UPI0036BEBB06